MTNSLKDRRDKSFSFSKQFVAFLDILGFSEFVLAGAPEFSKTIESVNDLYGRIRNAISESQLDIKLSIFSDSIMLSTPTSGCEDRDEDKEKLQALIWCVNKVCLGLLSGGFLSRGAIVEGFLLHEEDLILGPALIKAYQLESRTANVPRVIITGRARELIQENVGRWLLRSSDGPYYINTLFDLEQAVTTIPSSGWRAFSISRQFLLMKGCHAALVRLLEDSRDTPRHFEKTSWFANYFDRHVVLNGPLDNLDWPRPLLPYN